MSPCVLPFQLPVIDLQPSPSASEDEDDVTTGSEDVEEQMIRTAMEESLRNTDQ